MNAEHRSKICPMLTAGYMAASRQSGEQDRIHCGEHACQAWGFCKLGTLVEEALKLFIASFTRASTMAGPDPEPVVREPDGTGSYTWKPDLLKVLVQGTEQPDDATPQAKTVPFWNTGFWAGWIVQHVISEVGRPHITKAAHADLVREIAQRLQCIEADATRRARQEEPPARILGIDISSGTTDDPGLDGTSSVGGARCE